MKKRLKNRAKSIKLELLKVVAQRLANGKPLPGEVIDYVKRGSVGVTPALPKQTRRKARQDFYASEAWRRLRYEALDLHGARCQCCGATRSETVQIHVDHIKPRARFPHLSLVLENLQILCGDCNLGKGARSKRDWRGEGSGSGTMPEA